MPSGIISAPRPQRFIRQQFWAEIISKLLSPKLACRTIFSGSTAVLSDPHPFNGKIIFFPAKSQPIISLQCDRYEISEAIESSSQRAIPRYASNETFISIPFAYFTKKWNETQKSVKKWTEETGCVIFHFPLWIAPLLKAQLDRFLFILIRNLSNLLTVFFIFFIYHSFSRILLPPPASLILYLRLHC